MKFLFNNQKSLIEVNLLCSVDLAENLFGHDVTIHQGGSPLFVFYPRKAVFCVVIPRV